MLKLGGYIDIVIAFGHLIGLIWIDIFLIGGIYIFRGMGELIYETTRRTHSTTEIAYSSAALAIGLLFIIGGLKKWQAKQNRPDSQSKRI